MDENGPGRSRQFHRYAWYALGLVVTMVCLRKVVSLDHSLTIGGDNTQVWFFAKSYIDGFGFRFNPRVGFPGTLDSLFFPTFDFGYRAILWIAGQFTVKPEISMLALYVVGTASMYLFAALGLSSIGIRSWLAAAGGVAFVVTPYFQSRWLVHDFLSLYLSAGGGAALALMIGLMPQKQSVMAFLYRPFPIAAILAAAAFGLYYGFFTCMFAMFAGVANAAWNRRFAPIAVSLIVCAVVMPLLVLGGYGTDLMAVMRGDIPQVARHAYEQLVYGLQLGEAVGVLAQLPRLEWVLTDYDAVSAATMAARLFEWPGLLLTAIILASPLVAVLTAKHEDGHARLIFVASVLILFGIMFCVRGGLGYYFGLFVAPHIRATDRVMPFLTFFAIASALAFCEISLKGRVAARLTVVPLVLLALGWTVWENARAVSIKQTAYAEALGPNIVSARAMLAAKDASGLQAILQLPIAPWPEAGRIEALFPYVHQNAYILDQNGHTEWSYGASPGTDALKQQQEIAREPSGAVHRARAAGFDGILIEKSGLTPADLSLWVKHITGESGCVLYDDERRVLFSLVCS